MLLGAKRCCEVASDTEKRGGKSEWQAHVVRLVDSTTGYSSDVLGLYDCSLYPRGKRKKVAPASIRVSRRGIRVLLALRTVIGRNEGHQPELR